MPIRIPDALPAASVLQQENVFVMTETRALNQDIRPLKVIILNLMPKKIETENQIMRLLSNSSLQVDVELLRVDNRTSKNTPSEHLNSFYRNFEQIKDHNYDGLIITGAPLGLVAFEDVIYWPQVVSYPRDLHFIFVLGGSSRFKVFIRLTQTNTCTKVIWRVHANGESWA